MMHQEICDVFLWFEKYFSCSDEGNEVLVRISGLGLIFLFLLFLVEESGVQKVVAAFVAENSTYLLVGGLIFTTIILYEVMALLFAYVVDNFRDRIGSRGFIRKMRMIGANEKYILSLFVDANKVTCPLDPNDVSVNYLESAKIIFRTNEMKDGRLCIYRISPIAGMILKKNPNWLR